jgi:hypothetical protein
MTMSGWLYVICVLISVLGRVLGHSLGARKELANRNRQYRLERLADAWRSIQLAASDTTAGARHVLERALVDVQLFGTPGQVTVATRAVLALDTPSDRAPMLLELLEALRGDVRREMRLRAQVTPLATIDNASVSDAQPLPLMTPRRPRLLLIHGRPRQRPEAHAR